MMVQPLHHHNEIHFFGHFTVTLPLHLLLKPLGRMPLVFQPRIKFNHCIIIFDIL